MKTLNKILLLGIILIYSCGKVNKHLDKDYWLLAKPFHKGDTFIYHSEQNEYDTLIVTDISESTNNPQNLEQGLDERYAFVIKYKLSPFSKHKLLTNDKTDVLLSLRFSSADYHTLSFGFFSLAFDESYLDNLKIDPTKEIFFDKEDARYNRMNMSEKISSFVFSINKGVISFYDVKGNKWTLIN